MKLGPIFLTLLLGALTSVRAAEPNFEFTGLISAEGKTRFALTDKATDVTEWVELGSDFKGFSVEKFEAKEDRVVLKKDGREFPLRLTSPSSPARPRGPAPALSGTVPPRVATPPPAPPASTPPVTVIAVPSTSVAPAPVSPTATTPPPPAPAALPPAAREPESPTHVIQGGDTWEKISTQTGVSVEELQRLNPVIKGSSLPSGQTIRIK